jgi:hypothetical protein
MKKKLFWLLLLSILVLGLAACNRSSATPCTPSDLEPPTPTSPGHYYHVGTGPTTGSLTPEFFEWEFDPNCTPEHFKIKFSPDRHFGIARSGMTDGELTWPPTGATFPQVPLEPATEYFWNVRAWTDGVNGPDSATRVFFTGPLCGTAGEMGAPELLSPDPGEIINELYAELHYQVGEPKCVPEGYLIDLQTDPTFSGTNLLTSYGIPGTYVLTDELIDCTTYYWRVAPLFGGAQGPFSETRAFNVHVSSDCPMVSAVPDLVVDTNLMNLMCNSEDLTPPELLWPPHNSQVGMAEGPPQFLPAEFFQWTPIGCIPDKYKIRFSHDPDWGIARAGDTDGETIWPSPDAEFPQVGLEPATEYFWNVRAWTDGINGPDSPTWTFFTGPMCDVPADLVAPELIEPEDGAEIAALEVILNFQPGEPGCIPDGYYLDLQTVADFSGTNPYAGDWGSKHTFMSITGLADCTTYYWRIAQVEDATFGPFSASRSFFTNESGLCAQSMVPQIEALRDLACYEGPVPGTYPILGYLVQGETAPIVAQSLNQTWWYIQNPDAPNICAVPKDGGEPEGDTSGVPLWNDPEVPTDDGGGSDGPNCSSYHDKTQCESAGCYWYSINLNVPSFACYSNPKP